MTIYCPSCGKPNTDEASNCISCGTELAKKKAARFKGTMMMSGPGALPGAPAGAAPPSAPPPAAPPAAAPGASQPPAAKKDLAFQKTMLGPMTAPPGMAPPPGGPAPFGAPPAAAAPQGFGAPAPQGGGFGAPAPAPQGGGFGAPAPAPQGGGFGAPAPAPQGGGFGAPAPAVSGFGATMPESSGGFGAPPPAGGGFGAPAGAPPAGGFGAPAAGGFGAPAGAPPAGGFGDSQPSGGFSGAPMAAEGEKPKSKMPMIIGGCCLLILLISCSVGGFLWWKTSQAIDSVTGGEGLMGAANRLALNTHFTSFTSVCAADPSGASAAGSFHPSVAPTYQALACQVPAGAAAAVQDATRCPGSGSDEGRAAPLSIDPATCSTITCGTGKAVVCGGLIVHLENPASFQ